METDIPNPKYDHVYAIIRLDTIPRPDAPLEQHQVVVKKLVRCRETAEQEVERLNRLNADKGCVYFWQLTRLEKAQEEQQPAGAEMPASEVSR